MTKELFQNICLQFLNVPYLWGGPSPMVGVDCSHLVKELLSVLGIGPQEYKTAEGLRQFFVTEGNGKLGVLDTGSIVFYGSNDSAHHVGMILSSPFMIEAAPGDSSVTNIQEAKSMDARVRVRPYTRRGDVLAIVQPNGLPWIDAIGGTPPQSGPLSKAGLPSFSVTR